MAFKKCSVLLKRGEEGSPKCFDDDVCVFFRKERKNLLCVMFYYFY